MIATAPNSLDWGEIYTEYQDRIRDYIRRRIAYNGEQELEDLTADVFVRAIDATKRGHGPNSHFNGWLYRIAHNFIIDEYRRREQWGYSVEWDELWKEPINEPTLYDRTQRTITVEKVRSAISQLGGSQAHTIMLRLEGYTNEEIAEIMGISTKAIRAVNTRAYKNLREWLREADQ